MILLEDN